MGVEVPERLEQEVLEIVREVTPGGELYAKSIQSPENVQKAVDTALMLWARRGGPVSDEIDRIIERAVRNAMKGEDKG